MHINATYAASKAQLFQPDYLPGKTPAVESYLPQIIREWATKDVALSVQYDPERTVRPGSEPKRPNPGRPRPGSERKLTFRTWQTSPRFAWFASMNLKHFPAARA